MQPAHLVGAQLVERLGTTKDGFVSLYDHPRHGRVVMRHDERGQDIYLDQNTPVKVRSLLSELREHDRILAERKIRNRVDKRDRV